MLHFAGDLDTICFARGCQGVAAGDSKCARLGPQILALSGFPTQGRDPRDAGRWTAPCGDTAGHGHRLQAECDLLRFSVVLGLGWEEQRECVTPHLQSFKNTSAVEPGS